MISIRFAVSSVLKVMIPVMLPPGRAKLDTMAPGPPIVAITTGIVFAFFAAMQRGPPRHNQVDLETNQFRREVRKPLGATIRRPIFDDQISPFDVAQLPQPLAQGIEIGGVSCRGYRL